MRSLSGCLQGDVLPTGVFRLGDSGSIGVDEEGTLLSGRFSAKSDPAMCPLANGDVVAITQNQQIRVIFRAEQDDNFLFLTNRCQNRCLFCCQPPSSEEDSWLIDEALAAIPLFPATTQSLGITGGEPTLNTDGLLAVLRTIKTHLPDTAVHLLSNGRRFAYLGLAQAVTKIGLRELMVGIPIHADTPERHDDLAGAPGSWGETVRGCLNLARCDIPVELRVVLVRGNHNRLDRLAEWIGLNMPFVAHVAWMGQEVVGLASKNADAVWIDPRDFQRRLATAVHHLHFSGIRTSIYNLPLCHLERNLWPFASSSISSWKRTYQPACNECTLNACCGGFFSTGSRLQARAVVQIPDLLAVDSNSQSFQIDADAFISNCSIDIVQSSERRG